MPLTLYWHKLGIVCKLFPLNCTTGDVENGNRLSSGMFPMKLNCKSRSRRESLVDVMFGNTVRELFDMESIWSLLAWFSASIGMMMMLLLFKLVYSMLYVLHVRSMLVMHFKSFCYYKLICVMVCVWRNTKIFKSILQIQISNSKSFIAIIVHTCHSINLQTALELVW